MEISPIKTITITDDFVGATSPRYRAIHRGSVLGWYDTLAEAEAALLAAETKRLAGLK